MKGVRRTFNDLMGAIAHVFVPYAYEEEHIRTVYKELVKRELGELKDAVLELIGEK